jgi:hyperosmotically inducible protein
VRIPSSRLGLLLALALTLPSTLAAVQTPAADPTVEGIRSELLQLPYYGVFDFIAFSYDKGTVTLFGYAYHGDLKAEAERAVKRASRVDQVVDTMENLPVSTMDDEVRWKTYYAIYRDPFLQHYAPGGAMLWGHRHPFHGAFGRFGPSRFPGAETAGDYPIHIIVKGLRITLLGVVDNASDKNVAGLKARGVTGALGVDNELAVEGS